ncbi:MAG: gliding motility-associated ABC transporter substrate-binding protein GldG, partial [Saprospiraceae bacterium]|nr:gliding motility-associated ABC transporter substrate-binding protein GldG [Saprospiraceae bacterium]
MNRIKHIYDRLFWLVIILVGVVLINLAGGLFHARVDLTEDKRYTLTNATRQIVSEVDAPIFIQVLLEGKFPPEFRRLPVATRELLEQLKKLNNNIQYRFEDPLAGEKSEVQARLDSWAQVGIIPTELNVRDAEGQSRQRIYPFAIFNYGDRQVAINLLEESGAANGDVALNNSITLLEYKFVNAIAKLRATNKPNILFTSGHGELNERQTLALESNLRAFYNTGRVNLDSVYQIPEEIALLIIAKPMQTFSEKNLFVIDQYIMNGGNVMFLVDPLVVSLDSIRVHGQYLPPDNDVGLDQMLFKYGARVNKNFVLDLNCTPIPLAINRPGGNPEYNLFKWYYNILAEGVGGHPIVKGLDPVNLSFPASIDTIKTGTVIHKTPLLQSSPYSRLQYNPVLLDFEILKTEPDQSKFNDGPQTVALLLEGNFESVYKNRVSPGMQTGLSQIGATYVEMGRPAKILVVSDGDIARNGIDPTSGEIRDLGFNQYLNYTFANKPFLTNAVEY